MASPRVTVEAPPRKAPRGGLFSVANVIDGNIPHLGAGVQYMARGCAFPQLAPGLCWAAINPETIIRTNYVTSPQITSAGVGWSLPAGPESYSPAGMTIAGPFAAGTVAQASWSVGDTPTDTQFMGSVKVTYTSAGTDPITLHLELFDFNGETAGSAVTFAPGETKTLIVGPRNRDGESNQGLKVVAETAVPADSSVTINQALLEATTDIGGYFDGDSVEEPPYEARWAGAANASRSLMAEQILTKTPEGIGHSDFGSFALYAGVECFLSSDDGDYEARARELLLEGEQKVVEEIFEANVLSTLPTYSLPATFYHPVSNGEYILGKTYPALGTIHASRGDVAGWFGESMVEHEADWSVVTGQGTPVANGAGYSKGNFYVTGQVTIWRGGVATYVVADHLTNRRMAIAERVYVIGYDCVGYKIPSGGN